MSLGSQSPIFFPPVSSWANVVQTKKSLKKYDLNISNQNGINLVMVPDEFFKDSSSLWADFLISRFLATAPYELRFMQLLIRFGLWENSKILRF